MTELHRKYRPETFDDVRGHDAAKASLQAVMEKGGSSAFLFSGPSGVGKTTFARIVAREFGCDETAIQEVDAASKTGVDDMREITGAMQYGNLLGSGKRAIIVDECHRLSGNAWDSLLKSIEEPPPHVVWLFCTTNVGKVPDTIQTRCVTYHLDPLTDDNLRDLLEDVAKAEELEVEDRVLGVAVKKAAGSPRQALVYLSMVAEAEDAREAADIIGSTEGTPEAIDLVRAVAGGKDIQDVLKLVAAAQKANNDPETVRCILLTYVTTMVVKGKTDDYLFGILEAFKDPYYTKGEKFAPFVRDLGRVL